MLIEINQDLILFNFTLLYRRDRIPIFYIQILF